jgi:hypothetical protein
VSLDVYSDDSTQIARGGFAERRGTRSRIYFDYLIGEAGRGYRHLREVEELRLTPPFRLRRLLSEAGVTATWVPPGEKGRAPRGWLVGVAPEGR